MKWGAMAWLSGLTVIVQGQLTVDPSMTPEDYVQNVLLGGGVTVSNVTFNGAVGNMIDVNGQIGSFDASMANVGISEGLILSSGNVGVALGPNNDAGATIPGFPGVGGPGDPDLDMIAGVPTEDAAILEFDFIPSGDSLNFNFVFASEEYLEFVNGGFNDPFGFFINGPGFAGPFTNGAENIALVPGTTTPITIDNVNDLVNMQFYVDNGDGNMAPFNTDSSFVQFDGFTTVLTASALVTCGATYHIKLAIADAGDGGIDSAVFLEGGSFNSIGAIAVDVNTVGASGVLTEGCSEAELVITRPDTVGDAIVGLTLSGGATNGLDYSQVATPAIIPAGSNSLTIPFSVFQDNLAEGSEDIVFTVVSVNTCGDTIISTASVTIIEYDPISILTSGDPFLDCTLDSVQISAMASGGFGGLSFSWSTGANSTSTTVSGMDDGSYTVTVADDCNMSMVDVVTVNAGCMILIPNVFTPNADGSNDAFVVRGIRGTQNTVRIWNRWGNIVFEANNYRNTWRAPDVPDGTYFYEIIIEQEEPFTGHLTILR